jgi:hypothetical protein
LIALYELELPFRPERVDDAADRAALMDELEPR